MFFVAFSLVLKQTKWMREIITQLLEDRHFSRSGEVELEIAGTRYVDLQNSLRSKERRSIKAWMLKVEKMVFQIRCVQQSHQDWSHHEKRHVQQCARICSLKFWPNQFVVTRSLYSDIVPATTMINLTQENRCWSYPVEWTQENSKYIWMHAMALPTRWHLY